MAWDAQGRWVPDPVATTQTGTGVQTAPTVAQQPIPEQAPVTGQAQQLTGLLAPATTAATPPGAQTMTATAAPATATPTADPVPPPGAPPPPGPVGQPGDASVSNQLTGLLDSNSPYMRQARTAGERVAHQRGLLNSSIAAGSSEAAAIAAAAPIASQDAAQIQARNQSLLEGDINLRNATTLQTQQDVAAMERLVSSNTNQINLQTLGDTAAMARLIEQGGIEKVIEGMRESSSMSQTQINANVSLLSNYMSAFAQLSSNPELPASARNAYMSEFLRVTQSGQALVNALSGVTVTWPSTGPVTPSPTTPVTTAENVSTTAPKKKSGGGLLGGLLGGFGLF